MVLLGHGENAAGGLRRHRKQGSRYAVLQRGRLRFGDAMSLRAAYKGPEVVDLLLLPADGLLALGVRGEPLLSALCLGSELVSYLRPSVRLRDDPLGPGQVLLRHLGMRIVFPEVSGPVVPGDGRVRRRATTGGFTGTSTRAVRDHVCRETHSPYDPLKRDDHLGSNSYYRALVTPRSTATRTREIARLLHVLSRSARAPAG